MTRTMQAGGTEAQARGPDERALVKARRSKAGLSDDEVLATAAGLAFSGGGIRSATFCLGLARGMAKSGVFKLFDYLSTVSGGGYVGSAIGRLYRPARSARATEKVIAADDTLFLWWLRSNGRYLTPAGTLDLLRASASILRGMLATHVELGMLFMVAAGIMLLPYVILNSCIEATAWMRLSVDPYPFFGSIWLWIAALPVICGAVNIFGYWICRDPSPRGRFADGNSIAADWIAALIMAGAAWVWAGAEFEILQAGPGPTLWHALLSLLACALLFSLACALVVRLFEARVLRWTVSQGRAWHTKALATNMAFAGIFLLVAAADWVSQFLADDILGPRDVLHALPVVLTVAIVGSRTVMPVLMRWRDRKSEPPPKTEALLNIVGIVLLAGVALAWFTLFQVLASPDRGWHWLAGMLGMDQDDYELFPIQWAICIGLPLLYVTLTSANIELLNLSSLHHFYRSRIERAYVSTGDDERFGAGGSAAKATPASTAGVKRLLDVVPGDDCALSAYRPQDSGGPVHLITCCINQTIDDRTGNYNADRNGIALTVSSLGAEIETAGPDGAALDDRVSTWVSVSGAAASSGMGSYTSPGLAAILFMSGLRLGYWRRSLDPAAHGFTTRPILIRDELFAKFPGLKSPQWYLSDGGHFENTGVYALLKRRLPLIVAADCGGDPDSRFEDLENLVRKATIDHRIDIALVAPTDAMRAADPALAALVGLPQDITSRRGDAFLLLARITYPPLVADGEAEYGTLVLVKPRVPTGTRWDTACYGRRNEVFPQEATSDQFFDEAQWEAYHQLGLELARALTADRLRTLQSWVVGRAPVGAAVEGVTTRA